MAISDAHIHLFRDGFAGRYGAPVSRGDADTYDLLRTAHDIDCALVVCYEGTQRYAGNNGYVAEVGSRCSWVAAAAYLPCWPPPSVEMVRSLAAEGFCGVGLWVPTAVEARQVSHWPEAVVREIASSMRVVSFNATPEATSSLGDAVRQLAPCTALFSHLGLPGRYRCVPTAEGARERLRPLLDLAGYENVGVKLSGCYAVSEPSHAYPHEPARPFATALADAFGPDRLYWGSDFPTCLDWVSFAQTIDLPLPNGLLSPAETAAVQEHNLRRLLGRAS